MIKSEKTAPVVGRFAPTPSGRLHLGNLMCALVAWLSARSRGGKCLLRIEDLDSARCPFMGENTKYLLDDLAWMGLSFDGEVLYQSKRSDVYEKYLATLRAKGLIYPCYCSRAELHAASAPHLSDNTPIYDRKCLDRAKGERHRPQGVTPHSACWWRIRRLLFLIPLRGHTVKTCCVIAVISWSDAPTACLPISLPWWWMMRSRASPRWCVATTCSAAHRARCILPTCWAFPSPPIAIYRC